MATHSSILLGLTLLLSSCGGPPKQEQALPPPTPVPGDPAVIEPQRSPDLLWWQGAEPACADGELKRRGLTWGAVFWCESAGQKVDQHLQNDLGKLARCISESVNAFQEEPEVDALGVFLAKAQEAGLNPILCSAVRRDRDVRTYHGRTVLMERRVLLAESASDLKLMYRFSCEDCAVAAETTVVFAP